MPQNLKTLVTQSLYPKITNVTTGSATAVIPAGGETVTVTGSGFLANAVVWVNNASVSTTFVSSTSLTFTSTAQTAGFYQLSIVNTDGSVATRPGGLIYNAAPVWSTSAGALPSAPISSAYSTTLVATSGTIVYTVTSGSLPDGLTLNSSTGVISGTPTVQNTYNFTVTATNQYNQTTARAFSILVSSAPSTIEVLMVAGGGGGANASDSGGGGAGAGGLLYSANFSVSAGTTYNLVVGAGGANQSQGSNTTGFGATAIGGGRAGGGGRSAPQAYAGGNGGSGGGGSGFDSYLAAGNATQGNSNGMTGYGNNGGPPGSGSGGGAGAAGTSNGPGGIGRQYSISGTATYYAGGGGAPGQAGGLGGGAAGASNTNGNSGTANTGGGAGGTYNGNNNVITGGSGGSGIIIVRHSDTFATATTTGSPTVTTTGGYKTYVFNGNGSITW